MKMRIALGSFALIVLLTLAASFSNFRTYHLLEKNGAVEVWKGKFAPLGKTLMLSLPGAHLSEAMKTTGSKKAISPFIVNYYLEKADSHLDSPGLPDFIEIKSNLDKASPLCRFAGIETKG